MFHTNYFNAGKTGLISTSNANIWKNLDDLLIHNMMKIGDTVPTNANDSVEHMVYFYDALKAAMLDDDVYYEFYQYGLNDDGHLRVHVILSKHPIDLAEYLYLVQ
jgi:hypothetical protein